MEPETILFFANASPEWQQAVNDYIERKKLSKQLQKLIIAYAIQHHYRLSRKQLPTIFNIINEKAGLNLPPIKQVSLRKFWKLKHKTKNHPKLDPIPFLDYLLAI